MRAAARLRAAAADAADQQMVLQEAGAASAGEMLDLAAACWDPHDPQRIVTAGSNGVQVHDARCSAEHWRGHSGYPAPQRQSLA